MTAEPEPIHERPIRPDEVAEALALWKSSGLHSIRPVGRDSPEALARQSRSDVTSLIGLWAGSTLVGVVLASHDGRKGWINRLAIDPARRGRGLAHRLLHAAETWLRSEGIEVIAVLVEEDNHPSLSLFTSEGYVLHKDIFYLTKRTIPDA
jgi:GNAT superfamily N-acetyltransferase